jgi:hypothetical protein
MGVNGMNGMNLAALLGAATWFGQRAEREPEAPAEEIPAASDDAAGEGEFIWGPNPLFQ